MFGMNAKAVRFMGCLFLCSNATSKTSSGSRGRWARLAGDRLGNKIIGRSGAPVAAQQFRSVPQRGIAGGNGVCGRTADSPGLSARSRSRRRRVSNRSRRGVSPGATALRKSALAAISRTELRVGAGGAASSLSPIWLCFPQPRSRASQFSAPPCTSGADHFAFRARPRQIAAKRRDACLRSIDGDDCGAGP